MLKKFIRKQQLYFCMAVLEVFAFFYGGTFVACAETGQAVTGGEIPRHGEQIPGKSLTKRIPLNDETVTQIPRYIMLEKMLYILDESEIIIEETGYGSSEGADVVIQSKTIESLPDNDLERIEKTVTMDGIVCELLCVVYTITGRDENGIPNEYSAVCEYGGLKKYTKSYAEEWQAIVRYDAYETEEIMELPILGWQSIKRNYIQQKKPGNTEDAEGEENEKDKKTIENELLMKKEPHQKKEKDDTNISLIPFLILMLAAAFLALLFFLLNYLSDIYALLFSLTEKGRYRYIGPVRLREKEGTYIANLTERLIAKAEILTFKIIIPKKILKKIKTGIFQVKCPDGKILVLIPGKEIVFIIERN